MKIYIPIFLLALYILPPIALPGGGLVSMALVLFPLALFYLVKNAYLDLSSTKILLLSFIVLTLAVFSLFLNNFEKNVIYIIQFLMYVPISLVFGILIRKLGLFGALRYIAFPSVIFILGAIISLVTGPIYPETVWSAQRHYGSATVNSATGFMRNPNDTGGILFTIFLLYFIFGAKRFFHKTIYMSALICMALTLSRSALFAAIIALISYFLLRYVNQSARSSKISSSKFTKKILTVPIIVFSAIYLYNFLGLKNIIEIGFNSQKLFEDVGERETIWTNAAQTFDRYSYLDFLIGKGPRSSFREVDGWITSFHNLYLTLFGDYGLIGLCLIFYIFLYCYRKICVKGGRYAIFATIFLIFTLIYNFPGERIYSPYFYTLLIAIIGSTIVRLKSEKDSYAYM